MKEYELIEMIAAKFKRSPNQKNALFTSDAEIITLDGNSWAFTMDDFSPEEDLFRFNDFTLLGKNLAVATLSDLFAVGATPQFYMHTCAFPKSENTGLIEHMMLGISSVLKEVGCFLCGGDIGHAEPWRYVGMAFGKLSSSRLINRVLPIEPQTLWITGELGDANWAAFSKQNTPVFECRLQESQLLKEIASACMDTSGGLFDAVWTMHELQPEVDILIDLNRIPYSQTMITAVKSLSLPIETALMGGAGEYELLFAVPENQTSSFMRKIGSHKITQIGTIMPAHQGSVRCIKDGVVISITQAPLCPRSFPRLEDYIAALIQTTTEVFIYG